MYYLYFVLFDNKSDINLGLFTIFLNNTFGINFFAIFSNFDFSNRFEFNFKESKDKLASNDKKK